MTFKIEISQFYDYSEPKQTQHFFMGHIKSDTISFFIKKYQGILMTFKTEISLTKVNLNNGIKTKSLIFPWDIFKSEIIFHWK